MLTLPGFYFDEAKNRYFPISQQPQTPLPSQAAIPEPRKSSGFNLPQRFDPFQLSWPKRQVDAFRQYCAFLSLPGHLQVHPCSSLLLHHYPYTSLDERAVLSATGKICNLKTLCFDGTMHQLIADDAGCLSSRMYTNPSTSSFSRSVTPFASLTRLACTHRDYVITSLAGQESQAIATTMGQRSTVFMLDLRKPDSMEEVTFHKVVDIRACGLEGSQVILGAAKQVIFSPDLDLCYAFRRLKTGSDVFSVTQQQNLVYGGLRNGTISLFDVRMERPQAERVFPLVNYKAPVTHLSVVGEHCFFSAWGNGHMALFDRRFSRNSLPLLSFSCLNSLSSNHALATAVDPPGNFVYAAGDDCQIRSWSLRTGQQLALPANLSHGEPNCTLFGTTFMQPPTSLEVMRDIYQREVLSIAAGPELFSYQLGQRAH